jgi:endonuclease YncB( thermonuclease family)
MKRRAYKIILPVGLVAALFFTLSNFFVDYNHAKVSSVVDGDTVIFTSGRHVRYIGLDAPELERNTPAGWVKVHEPFADDAKRLNEELVLGKTVRLEFDQQKEDKYHRLLAYCFVKAEAGELLVQAEILRRGLAYFYMLSPNFKYADTLATAMQEAKAKKLGLWSSDSSIGSQDAVRFIGERKMVRGFVNRSRASSKVIRLSMDGLSVVIFKSEAVLFEKQGIDPAEFYKGKTMRVFGLIKEYQGELEIIVSNPWQIEVLEQ